MYDKDLNEIYGKIKVSLADKEYVSVPEIQAVFDLSYPMAKLAIERLKEDLFVLDEPEGMKYPVSSEAQPKRSISSAEAVYYRSYLPDDSVAWLKAMKAITRPKPEAFEKHKILFDFGLARSLAGRMVYAIDKSSVDLITSFDLGSDNWFLALTALEIAYGVKSSGSASDLKKISFLSDRMLNMIDNYLDLPSIMMPKNNCGYTMGKFELMEAFITHNILPDIEGYRSKAKSELKKLEELGIGSGFFADTMRECIKELEDLTYENLEEIRKLIMD